MNLMKPFFSFLLFAFLLTLPAMAAAGDEGIIFSSDFSAAELPPEISPKHGTRWVIEDGVLVGQPATEEQQEKNKAAGTGHYGRSAVASVQSRFEDAIIEFEFRIKDGKKLVFVGNAPGRSHLFNVNLSPEEASLMRFQDKKAPADKKEVLAKAPVRLPAGEWSQGESRHERRNRHRIRKRQGNPLRLSPALRRQQARSQLPHQEASSNSTTSASAVSEQT